MKLVNTFLAKTAFAVFVLNGMVFSQQWDGAQNLTGDIHRKGKVGIGTASPMAKLDVNGDLRVTNSGDGAVLLSLNSERSWEFQQLGAGPGTALKLKSVGGGVMSVGDAANKNFVIETNGNVGIGTMTPRSKLDVGGDLRVTNSGDGAVLLNLNLERSWAFQQLGTGPGTALKLKSVGGGGNKNFVIETNGNVGIGTTTPQSKLHVNGTTTTRVLTITGGADLSEQFHISKESESIEAGMVVSIDAENPGKLAVSLEAYDRKVAGIVSGAGGVQSGMLMGQKGSIADGSIPVALTGRV